MSVVLNDQGRPIPAIILPMPLTVDMISDMLRASGVPGLLMYRLSRVVVTVGAGTTFTIEVVPSSGSVLLPSKFPTKISATDYDSLITVAVTADRSLVTNNPVQLSTSVEIPFTQPWSKYDTVGIFIVNGSALPTTVTLDLYMGSAKRQTWEDVYEPIIKGGIESLMDFCRSQGGRGL